MSARVTRIDRARKLVLSVHPVGDHTYLVESERGEAHYRVDLRENACTCPAFTYGDRPCKHLLAARIRVRLTGRGR